MWQNSNELLDYAFRELQKAIAENKQKVEIVIGRVVRNDFSEIKKVADNLDIRLITEKLRMRLNKYQIKSKVSADGQIKDHTCGDYHFLLTWELELQKKEV